MIPPWRARPRAHCLDIIYALPAINATDLTSNLWRAALSPALQPVIEVAKSYSGIILIASSVGGALVLYVFDLI